MRADRLFLLVPLVACVTGCEAVTGLDRFSGCAQGCDSPAAASPEDTSAVVAPDAAVQVLSSFDAQAGDALSQRDGAPDGAAIDQSRAMDSSARPGEVLDSGGPLPDSGGWDAGEATDSGPCAPSTCPACSNPLEPIHCCTAAGACGCTPNLLGLFCQ
jgi:hypothetical protein